MRVAIRKAAGAALSWAVLSATPGYAATFTSQPIVILGNAQVAALGINDAGAIAGELSYSPMTGFVAQGSSVSILQSAIPTAINANGDVTGFNSQLSGFLWKAGAFVPGVIFPLGVFDNVHLSPVLNRADELAFSSSNGQAAPVAFRGSPTHHFHPVRGLSASGTFVNSINDRGVIAGTERVTLQGQPVQVVFFGKSGFFSTLLSPAGQQVSGGFLNDSGQVAYTDGAFGYVYSSGKAASFSLPGRASMVQVQAINDRGRVVGSYIDDSQNPPVQRGFLYNGLAVSVFGSYGANDLVQVSLNNRGAILVSDTAGTTPSSAILHCHGDGC